jgi:hypothetical protein
MQMFPTILKAKINDKARRVASRKRNAKCRKNT